MIEVEHGNELEKALRLGFESNLTQLDANYRSKNAVAQWPQLADRFTLRHPALAASSYRPVKSAGPHPDVRRLGDVEVFRASLVTCENAASKYDDAVHFPLRWRGALI